MADQNTVSGADSIQVSFLCQGCQSAEEIARQLAGFISQATQTLDIAIYSFYLGPTTQDIIAGALHDRAAAGVGVRIAYDAGTQQSLVTGYATSTDAEPPQQVQMQAPREAPFAVAAPGDTRSFVGSLGLPCKAIEGYRALMHDKYAVIDSGTPQAQIWTGSSNWTDDSWTLQESNIIILQSQELAAYYTNDFNELWVDGNIATSGAMDSGTVVLQYDGQPAQVNVDFAPGEGLEIDQKLTELIERTQQRLTIAAVVLTSGSMIGAIQKLINRGVPIEGIYDATQMEGVMQQWQSVPNNHWKIPAWQEIVRYGHLVGKHSTPYTPTSKHDYMHNKVLVADGTVVTGSYNFSRHAQGNAENILTIDSEALAQTYRQYIHRIMQQYA